MWPCAWASWPIPPWGDIEVQAETQMQSRLALSKDVAAGFDPLEFDRFTRVQELTRMMAESVNDVAKV